MLLDREGQLNRFPGNPISRAWKGPEDCSGKFFFGATASDLLFAGEIRDDVHRDPEGHWWDGDAVELFLCTEPRDGEPAAFDGDDYQIFLMPMREGPRWGVWLQNGIAAPTDGGFLGVRVAARPAANGGYTFEAAIPFANLPFVRAERRSIGVNVAIDDADGPEGTRNYLVWTGDVEVYRDARRMGRLELPENLLKEGPAPLLPPLLLSDLLFALAGLTAMLLLFVLARRTFKPFEKSAGLSKCLGLASAVLIVAFLLTAAAQKEIDRRARRALEPSASVVEKVLEGLAQGTLGPLAGQEPEEAALALFAGRPVSPKPHVQYVKIPLGLPSALDRSRDAGIPFYRYGLPLEAGRPLSLDLETPRTATAVALAVEFPESGSGSPSSERIAPSLGLTLGHPEGGTLRLVLEDPSPSLWARGATSFALFEAPLGQGFTAHRMELLPTGMARATFQGISFFASGQWEPATLGFRTLEGVPTLAGGRPAAGSGHLLEPGGPGLSVEVGKPADRVWLLLSIEGEEGSRESYGKEALEVVVEDPEGALQRFGLRREIDLHSSNLDRSPHRSDMESREAYLWEEPGSRLHVDSRELRLPGRTQVVRIRCRNLSGEGGQGRFPVRLHAVTIGTLLSPKAPSEGIPLQSGPEGIQLAPEAARDLEGLRFSWFASDGTSPSSSLGAGEMEKVFRKGARTPSAETRVGGEGLYGELFPVREGDRIVGALEMVRQDDSAATWKRVAGLLPLLAFVVVAPFLVYSLAEAVSRFSRIRRKLLGGFLLTSVIPILVLLLFLSDLLLRRYRSAEAESLRAAFSSVEQRLLRRRDAVSQAAGSFARAFLDHPRVRDLLDRPERLDYAERLRQEVAAMHLLVAGVGEGSFLRFEDHQDQGESYSRRVVVDGEGPEGFAGLDVPEAGFYRSGGRLLAAGVQRVQEEKRRFVFVVGEDLGRTSEDGFLLRFYSPTGFPLAGNDLEDLERSPARIEAVRGLLEESLTLGEPLLRQAVLGERPCRLSVSPLRSPRGEPVAYFGLAKPEEEYLLSLGITEIPLRRGLLLFGGLVVLSALVVVRTLTSRITNPIERLEAGARALQAGERTEPVPSESPDEVGELTRSFNAMAEALRQRLAELSSLNQGLREMTARLDLPAVAAEAIRLIVRTPGAQRAFIVLQEPDGLRAQLINGEGSVLSLEEESDPSWLPRSPVFLSVALRVRGRRIGSQVLCSGKPPDSAELEFLQAAAGQVAIALENARLYRLAIEDPSTGAFNGTYFRTRLAEEVEAARSSQGPLSLLRISIRELELLLQRSKSGEPGGALDSAARGIRAGMPRGGILGRAGLGDFHLLLPGISKEEALRVAASLRDRVGSEPVPRGDGAMLRLRPKIAVASFPTDGESADVLLQALDPGRAQGRRAGSGVYDVTDRREAVRVEVAGEEVVFRSPRMLEVLATVERISGSDLSVLLQGETGVGKELIADLIHQQSGRADRPLVKINCAALPEGLLEAELFGAERGAYTGAHERRPGRFEAAHGGTVFLDEVAELPSPLQAKFLRVLQEKKVTRLGSTAPVEVDVRIVAATNQNLLQAVSTGVFRSDLYYRLAGISLVIPPLRERKEEIPDLVAAALRRFNAEPTTAAKVAGISPEALDRLLRHSWPGNVRELQNVVRRACLMSGSGDVSTEAIQFDAAPMPRLPGPPVPARAERAQPKTPIPEGALSDRQLVLIRHLVNHEVVTTLEVVSLASVSRRTALRDLSELVVRGILLREGKRRAAQYRLHRENLAKTLGWKQ